MEKKLLNFQLNITGIYLILNINFGIYHVLNINFNDYYIHFLPCDFIYLKLFKFLFISIFYFQIDEMQIVSSH